MMKNAEKNYDKSVAPKCDPKVDFGRTIPVGGEGGGLYLKNDPPARSPNKIYSPGKKGKGKMGSGGGSNPNY